MRFYAENFIVILKYEYNNTLITVVVCFYMESSLTKLLNK